MAARSIGPWAALGMLAAALVGCPSREAPPPRAPLDHASPGRMPAAAAVAVSSELCAASSAPKKEEKPVLGWKKTSLPVTGDALPGRAEAMQVPARHFVLAAPIAPPFPEGLEKAAFAMGCFWGAERKLWKAPGVFTTAVGYVGGATPNPTYREVCSGRTGHTEAVLVVFDPKKTSYEALLKTFWESHDPTQGMGQGNDVGTQYRSGIYAFSEAQRKAAEASRAAYEVKLREAGFGEITTELALAGEFYYAEEYHQQYLGKNPGGYCGLGGTGVACPVGLGER